MVSFSLKLLVLMAVSLLGTGECPPQSFGSGTLTLIIIIIIIIIMTVPQSGGMVT